MKKVGIHQPASHLKRVTWILQFVYVDLETLDDEAVYAYTVEAVQLITGASTVTGTDKRAMYEAYGPRRRGTQFSTPARTLLTDLQGRLTDGVDALKAGQPWQIAGPRRWRLEVRTDGTISTEYEDELRTRFTAAAAETLSAMWKDLRWCSRHSCGRRFLPISRRQQYCEPRCSNLARWARFAPKRERDYPAEYEARLKRRYGRKMRVHRHKRRKARQ
jgi:hypothetical protein